MKKLLLGALLLLSTLGFSQEITRTETISSNHLGLTIDVQTIRLNDVIIKKTYIVLGTTSNQFDKRMIIMCNSNIDILLSDLKKLRNLSITLIDKESTTFQDLTVYGSNYGDIYIFEKGYAGFASINTKRLNRLIDELINYTKLKTEKRISN